MEPLSDDGVVSLGLCPVTRRPLLVHHVSGETVYVPPGAICSSLAFTEGSGHFAVDGSDGRVVVSDHLRLTVAWDAEAAHWFVLNCAAGDAELLTDSLAKRQGTQVPLAVLGFGDGVSVTAFAFARRLAGSYIFWSLAKLWQVVGLAGKNAQSWYHRHWSSWVTRLAQAGVPESLLQRATGADIGSGSKQTPNDPQAAIPTRCLSTPAMSTHALVCMGFHWSRSAGCRSQDEDSNPRRWMQFMTALVQTYAVPAAPMSFSLTFVKSKLCPPASFPPLGGVTFHVEGGRVRWDPRELPPKCQVSTLLSKSGPGPLSLVDFSMLLFECPNVRYPSVLSQWLWYLGHWVEHGVREAKEILPPVGGSSAGSSNLAAASSGAKPPPPTVDGNVLDNVAESEASMERRLLLYWLACRQVSAACTIVGYAVDAGRVSKRGNFVGIFTTPENVAFWAPPQVARPAARGIALCRVVD